MSNSWAQFSIQPEVSLLLCQKRINSDVLLIETKQCDYCYGSGQGSGPFQYTRCFQSCASSPVLPKLKHHDFLDSNASQTALPRMPALLNYKGPKSAVVNLLTHGELTSDGESMTRYTSGWLCMCATQMAVPAMWLTAWLHSLFPPTVFQLVSGRHIDVIQHNY